MHCTYCKHPLSRSAKFCEACGVGLRNNYSRSSGRLAAIVLSFVGLAIVGIAMSNSGPSATNQLASIAPASNSAESQEVLASRIHDAPKLLAAASKEKFHPGLVYRFACQIPSQSTIFKQAEVEIARADRMWDHLLMRELRLEAAKKLQLGYYKEGRKIDVRAIEGPKPTLQLTYILFDETTAYAESDELAKTLLPLGFQKVSYVNDDGRGSYTEWKKADVEREEFGEIHSLCSDVREARKSPDAINATVKNPR